eukprot:8377878-Ditylum_brightwellii.AAC.2
MEDIHRVQQLKEGRGDWVMSNHKNGAIWGTDGVGLLKGFGKKTKEVVANVSSIENIGDLKTYYTPENVKHFLKGNKGVSAKKLQSIFDVASVAS